MRVLRSIYSLLISTDVRNYIHSTTHASDTCLRSRKVRILDRVWRLHEHTLKGLEALANY